MRLQVVHAFHAYELLNWGIFTEQVWQHKHATQPAKDINVKSKSQHAESSILTGFIASLLKSQKLFVRM